MMFLFQAQRFIFAALVIADAEYLPELRLLGSLLA